MPIRQEISPEEILKNVKGADKLDEQSLGLLVSIAQNASELADGMSGLLTWPGETVHFELNALSKTSAFKPVVKAARLARLASELGDEELGDLLWSAFQYGAGEPGIALMSSSSPARRGR